MVTSLIKNNAVHVALGQLTLDGYSDGGMKEVYHIAMTHQGNLVLYFTDGSKHVIMDESSQDAKRIIEQYNECLRNIASGTEEVVNQDQ